MRRNVLVFCMILLFFSAGLPDIAPHQFSSAQAQDGQRLVLRDSGGKELFSRPAPDGSRFAIRYRHSVALSPVEDWFSVSGGCIYLEKTVYQDFGAGLPHQPGPGQRMYTENGKVVISGYHMALPSFDVRVGRVADHTLLLPEGEGMLEEIPLNTLLEPGQAITLTIALP